MWKFEQSSGAFMDGSGFLFGYGYSGKNPEGFNNPKLQAVRDVGPIPRGWYKIEPPIVFKGMPVCMRLTPYERTNTHGRDGFLIHGDNETRTASTGCIILSIEIRELIAKSADAALQVVRASGAAKMLR